MDPLQIDCQGVTERVGSFLGRAIVVDDQLVTLSILSVIAKTDIRGGLQPIQGSEERANLKRVIASACIDRPQRGRGVGLHFDEVGTAKCVDGHLGNARDRQRNEVDTIDVPTDFLTVGGGCDGEFVDILRHR